MSPLVLFIILTFLYMVYKLIISMKRPANFPPGPTFMPIVGNTIQLRKEAIIEGGQHLVLKKWAKKYNSNIIGLKVGSEYMIYVQNFDLVKEVQLQEVYESRPDNFFIRLRTMGTRQGITCTEGKLWHEHRNFAMKQMRNVGYGKTQMEVHIVLEGESLVAYIKSLQEEPVWPGSFLAPSVINVLWSLTAGTRISRDDERLKHLLDLLNKRSKVFDMCGGLLSQFPWLRFIAPKKTGYNLICQLNQELYQFLMETINEHRERLNPVMAENDLIFAYLNEMQNQGSNIDSSTFNETQLVMTILDFFIAGSQTTSTTLDLSLMTLALHPVIQEKLYNEVISNTDSFQKPENEKEKGNFYLGSKDYYPYLNAFIMEIQRYFHIVPISGPRRSLWDTKLQGYDIPKYTTVLIGLGTVHMNEKFWVDPNEFRPERFINADGKLVKNEYFMPFGIGRRRCLGDALARACLFMFILQIVQRFKIELTEKDRPCLKLLPGITLSPKPYKVRFIER